MSETKYEFDDFELQVLANSIKDLLAKACDLEELDDYVITVGTPEEIGRILKGLSKKKKRKNESRFVVTKNPRA